MAKANSSVLGNAAGRFTGVWFRLPQLLLTALLGTVLNGCIEYEDSIATPATATQETVAVSVNTSGLPAATDTATLRVVAGVSSETPLGTDTQLTADAPHLVSLTDDQDNVLLMALSPYPGEGDNLDVSPLSTAVSLVVMDPLIAPLLYQDADTAKAVIATIAGQAEVQALADYIARRLAVRNDYLVVDDPQMQSALAAAVNAAQNALQGTATSAAQPMRMRRAAGTGGVETQDLQVVAPSGDRGQVTVTDTVSGGSLHTLAVTNSAQRYLYAELLRADDTPLGTPNNVYVSAAGSLISVNPLSTASASLQLDAADLANTTAKLKIYAPGAGIADVPWSKVATPTLETVSTQFAAPVLGLLLDLPNACITSLVFNLNSMMLNEGIVQSTMESYMSSGSLLSGTLYYVKEMNVAAMTNKSSVLTSTLGACLVSTTSSGVERLIAGILARYGTVAGLAVTAYQTTLTTVDLAASSASVFANPAYMEWNLNNYLRVSVNADTDYGARDGNFLAYCNGDASCGRVRWDFGDGNTQEAEIGQLVTHTYAADGDYTVSASLSDSDGATQPEDPALLTTTLTISSAPQVTATDPADGAIGVDTVAPLQVTFSQPMDGETITPYNLFLKQVHSDGSDDGEPLPATISYNPTTRTATLQPDSPLEANNRYRLYVGLGSGMKSTNGVLLLSTEKVLFSTPDNQPPDVTDVSPYSGGIGTVDTTLQVQFNESIATVGAANFALENAEGQAVAGTVSLGADNSSVVFTPTAPLAKNSAYTATVYDISDRSGNTLVQPYSWSFATEADAVDLKGLVVLGQRRDRYTWNSSSEQFVVKSLDGETAMSLDNLYSPSNAYFSPDGSHIIATTVQWSYGYGVPSIWTGYIIKAPLIPTRNGGWIADIEEQYADITGSDENWAAWNARVAEVTAREGTCVGLAKGTVSDPDQWVENENVQIWSAPCGETSTQLTHIGRADLSGSANPNDSNYNRNYGNMNYFPETFCALGRDSCGAYSNFYYYYGAYTHVSDVYTVASGQDQSIWFGLHIFDNDANRVSYELFQMSGGGINRIRELDTSLYWTGTAILDPDHNLLVANASEHVVVESLDGSVLQRIYAEPSDNPNITSSSLQLNGGGSKVASLDQWIHGDSDGDGVDNWDEHLLGLNGASADTDLDGVDDGEEIQRGTYPNIADSDGDGLKDGEELDLGTDPLNADSDGDFVNDGTEVAQGSDPLVPDTDSDQDGVDNETENALGTDPLNADSDGDGLDDGQELAQYTSPLFGDTDGDGLSDGVEVDNGLNPRQVESSDHDGDGVSTIDENRLGTNPLDPADFPITGYTLTELTAFGVFTPAETVQPVVTQLRGDDTLTSATLPWTFPFYGEQVTDIAIDTNGNLWLAGDAEDDHNFDLPGAYRPVLSIWNADLTSGEYGEGVRLAYLDNPPRVVANWDTEAYDDWGDGVVNNLETVLYPNGYVLYRYNRFTTTSQDDGGSGISLGNDSDFIDQTAILGTPVPTLGGRVFLYEPHWPDDSDDDGLRDAEEQQRGTDPNDPDSNDDGVKDGWQVYLLGGDPLSNDSDNDGIDNATEQALGTNPLLADSDSDGLSDTQELSRDGNVGDYQPGVDTDPTNPDSDGDGAGDGAEVAAGFDPLVAQTDHDGDGIDSLTEQGNGTDPLKPDSDDDGLDDGVETNTGSYVSAADTGTDPLNPDSDGDGVRDGAETNSGIYVDGNDTGTDPNNLDSDADGSTDGVEALFYADPNDPASQPISFATPTSLTPPIRVVDLYLRDLDGDGRVDMALGYDDSSDDNALAVRSNDGSGSFLDATLTTLAGRHDAMLLTDLNGDGHPDALLSNNQSASLTPLLNDGNGVFTEGTSIDTGTGSSPAHLVSGDFNEDGQPDFVATDWNDSTRVRVMLSNGNGGYTNSALYVADNTYPNYATSADFDGDGHQDLALGSDGSDHRIYLFMGDGSGAFPTRNELTVGYDIQRLDHADLNRDGRPDLIGSVDYARLGVWLNSAGGFLAPDFYTDLGPRVRTAIGDYNGDGRLDVAGVSYDGLSVWLGDGTGKLYGTPSVETPGVGLLSSGDIDGDGRSDVVMSLFNTSYAPDYGIALWHNQTDIGADSDSDGLSDRAETYLGTTTGQSDSDGDGLDDGEEFYRYHTDPANSDSDGDGVNDGAEINAGTDPLSPYSN